MKKIAAILLMGIMVLSIVSCGRNNTNNNNTDKNNTGNGTQNSTQNGTQNNGTDTTEGPQGTEITNDASKIRNAKEILTKIWATYEDRDTDNYKYNDKFSIIGGHHEAFTEGAPAEYDLKKAEDLEKYHFFPKTKIDLVDDVATMTHAKEAHEFSVSVYHMKDAAKVNEVVTAIEDAAAKHQWTTDDEPDELLIVTIGEHYILSAFGDDDLIHYFKTSVDKLYGNSVKIIVQREID